VTALRSSLYTGVLAHSRATPRPNAFRHPVAVFRLDLDELPQLERRLRLLGVERPNVVSLRARDHLGDPSRTVKENVVAFLASHGVELGDGRIELVTLLRVLGYVFNPVSFYYCHDADGALRWIVAEVNNTFGERLPYLLSVDDPDARLVRARHEKRLHVSPFFGLDQEYRWELAPLGEELRIRIEVWEQGRRPFVAVLAGRRRELSDAELGRMLVRYPLLPAQVIAHIHLQALRLLAKGTPFHRKPPFVPGVGSVRR
jgi:DUF1365 family protein